MRREDIAVAWTSNVIFGGGGLPKALKSLKKKAARRAKPQWGKETSPTAPHHGGGPGKGWKQGGGQFIHLKLLVGPCSNLPNDGGGG